MELILELLILLFSAVLHEIAHGYLAERFGDPTARLAGRLTLNPIKHIDPFMSILFPLFLRISGSPVIFGGAKPVPVDPYNLKEGRKDIALVALAGPITNVIIAILASFSYRFLQTPYALHTLPTDAMTFLVWLFGTIIYYNLLLAIFNLLPIPPLDGSKVFALLLPEKEANTYLSLSQFGMVILLFLLFFPIGSFSLSGLIYSLLIFAQSLLVP